MKTRIVVLKLQSKCDVGFITRIMHTVVNCSMTLTQFRLFNVEILIKVIRIIFEKGLSFNRLQEQLRRIKRNQEKATHTACHQEEEKERAAATEG